jgi:DNA-binding NarL/FixJ family response regulator
MTILELPDECLRESPISEERSSEIDRRTTTIRVLVVDRHPITRCGLSRIADEQADMESVGECGSIAGAIAAAAALRPAVVTIGGSLSDGDGLDLARELRDRYRDLGIVILTSLGGDDVLFRALDTGVSAFVSKSASAHEILGAIRHSAVAASSFSATGLAQAVRRRSTVAKRPLLSPREAEVLRLLEEGHSVPEVALRLFVSLSTAKTYVARLYEKLGATNRAQALMAAVRLDLVQPMRVVSESSETQAG